MGSAYFTASSTASSVAASNSDLSVMYPASLWNQSSTVRTKGDTRLLQSLVNHELSDFMIGHLQDFAQDIVVVLANFRTAPRRGGRRAGKTHPRSLDWYRTQPRMLQVSNMSA